MPDTTPTPDAKAILTPNQKRWLLLLGASILSALLGRYLPGVPVPPLPAESQRQIADTAEAVKRIEANTVSVLKVAGVPPQ